MDESTTSTTDTNHTKPKAEEQQQQQQVNLIDLEKRVARVEKLLRILDSELNNKIRWIIKTAGIDRVQQAIDDENADEDELHLQTQPPPQKKQRILFQPVRRKPARPAPAPVPSFLIPEVQYGDEEEDDVHGKVNIKQQNASSWGTTGTVKAMDEDGDYDYDYEVEDRTNLDDDEADDIGESTTVAVELGNGDGNMSADEDDGQDCSFEQSLRAIDGQDIADELLANDNVEDYDDDDLHDALPFQGHFMDVSSLRSSDTSMKRQSLIGTGRPAMSHTNSGFRVVHAGSGINRPKLFQKRMIIPRNRYLMSSSPVPRGVSRLQQNQQAGTTSADGDTKEKVYYCDRCPYTFTLSTRLQHYELHKQMDLKNKASIQDGSKVTKIKHKYKNYKTSSQSLLKPISSLSPPRRTRIRPRKVCPVCTKSYSRNQYLRNHILEHAAEYPYICKECFSVHNSDKELEDHCQGSDRCFAMYQQCQDTQ